MVTNYFEEVLFPARPLLNQEQYEDKTDRAA